MKEAIQQAAKEYCKDRYKEEYDDPIYNTDIQSSSEGFTAGANWATADTKEQASKEQIIKLFKSCQTTTMNSRDWVIEKQFDMDKFCSELGFAQQIKPDTKELEEIVSDENITNIAFDVGFGCDPPKGNKQQELIHDTFVAGMKKMRDVLLPHITPKSNTVDTDDKSLPYKFIANLQPKSKASDAVEFHEYVAKNYTILPVYNEDEEKPYVELKVYGLVISDYDKMSKNDLFEKYVYYLPAIYQLFKSQYTNK